MKDKENRNERCRKGLLCTYNLKGGIQKRPFLYLQFEGVLRYKEKAIFVLKIWRGIAVYRKGHLCTKNLKGYSGIQKRPSLYVQFEGRVDPLLTVVYTMTDIHLNSHPNINTPLPHVLSYINWHSTRKIYWQFQALYIGRLETAILLHFLFLFTNIRTNLSCYRTAEKPYLYEHII